MKKKKGKKKVPQFFPPGYGRRKRIKLRWRRPRGIDAKKRIELKYMGAVPKIGWRVPRAVRGLPPSGVREVLVRRPADLEGLADVAVRIARGVGARKRAAIIARAAQLGLRVVNP